jgi:hypothetical protein
VPSSQSAMAAMEVSQLSKLQENKLSESLHTIKSNPNPITAPSVQKTSRRPGPRRINSVREIKKGDNRMAQMLGSTDENRCVFKRTRTGSDDATVLELPLQRLEEISVSGVPPGTPTKSRIQRELGRSRSLSRLRSRVRPSVDDGECHGRVRTTQHH